MLEKITWPIAAVMVAAITGVVTLGVIHADTSVVTNLLTLLGLGALGGGIVGVHNLVNGNTSKQLAMIADAMDKLAAANPPPSDSTVDNTQEVSSV